MKFAQLIYRVSQLALLLLPLAALGSRFGFWSYKLGILAFALALALGLLIEIICAFWLMQKPLPASSSPLRKAALCSLPALIIAAAIMRANTGDAMLHDISTDTTTPPVFEKAILIRGVEANSLQYTVQKAEAQARLYPQIKPITTSNSAAENYQLALLACDHMGWEITYRNESKGIIEAIDTTFWFGFKDDIIIRVSDNRLDLRSISRVGKSDLGTNAKRIEAFSQYIKHLHVQ